MSTLLYGIGIHPLIYKAENFGTGKTVTAYIWSPTYVKSALQTFTESEEGFYYLAYNFTVAGTYHAKLYENDVAKTSGTFRVRRLGITKNVALSNFEFLMVSSSDHLTPTASLTITATISQDGGAFASCSNSVAEVSNGIYKINLTQAEMNADIITLKFTATGADQRTVTIITSN